MAKLLVVDDDAAVRQALHTTLHEDGHEVTLAEGLASGREAARAGADLVLLDVYLGGELGLDLLAELKAADPERPVIVISGAADIATALRAVRMGAWDFLEKPLSHARVRVLVRNALAASSSARDVRDQRAALLARHAFVGAGTAEVDAVIARAAPTSLPVLVTGESGTGKEIAAWRLHLLSPRWARPIVQVNCAALPRDLLESELFGHARGAFTGAADRRGHLLEADGGTLVLDEIGELDPSLQAKLLRVVEVGTVTRIGESTPRRVDVRFVASTHRDLEERIHAGQFRHDLWFRLSTLRVQIPPLRERPGDVAPIVEHLTRKTCEEINRRIPEIAPEAMRALEAHDWPGNVRELANAVRRTLVLDGSDRIERFDLGGAPPAQAPIAGKLADVKRELLRRHLAARLAAHGGSRPALARELGVHPNNLYRLLKTVERG